MKLEQKIITSRPSTAQTNRHFTDAVMVRITRRTSTPFSWFKALSKKSPVLAVIIAVVTIGIVSGTAYAIASFVWPQLQTRVSTAPSISDRTALIATDCDEQAKTKRYELNKEAPVPADKIDDVVKAQCELDIIRKWSDKEYPMSQLSKHNYTTPGAERTVVTVAPPFAAFKIERVTNGALSVIDSSTQEPHDVTANPDTKVIIGGRYGSLSELASGDVVTYLSRETTTLKNHADCSEEACDADIVATSSTLLVIIKLSYPFDAYRAIASLSLIESATCDGNEADICPRTSSVDVFFGGGADITETQSAEISGKITSYNDQSIALSTKSGRTVVVGTPWNLIQKFNEEKSNGYGFAIDEGDTLRVMYNQKTGSANDSEISWKSLWRVDLLMEAETRAGPFYKY